MSEELKDVNKALRALRAVASAAREYLTRSTPNPNAGVAAEEALRLALTWLDEVRAQERREREPLTREDVVGARQGQCSGARQGILHKKDW
jgi:hypothetical protein